MDQVILGFTWPIFIPLTGLLNPDLPQKCDFIVQLNANVGIKVALLKPNIWDKHGPVITQYLG